MFENKRITLEQEAILDRFTCQRLTDDPRNETLIEYFRNRRSRALEDKLRYEAWEEDKEGVTATYYVVKAPSGEIAMYFSLKCGTLCDPSYVQKVLQKYDRSQDLMDVLHGKEGKEWAHAYIESLRTSNGVLPFREELRIMMDYADVRDEKRTIKKEKKSEPNSMILRVDEAFPAIELVHFCVNDSVRAEWKALGLGHPMGEVLFWRFIVPQMLRIQRLVGCEYAYLFAADLSRDGSLIRYYENLHFECPKSIGGIKPWYDFLCTFMCKRLLPLTDFRRNHLEKELREEMDPKGLSDYLEEYFENFNDRPTME